MTTTQSNDLTIAQTVAAAFDDDGQCWKTAAGVSFDDACMGLSPRRVIEIDLVRYEFDDGSVLTEGGGCWDFGFVDCMCWQGADHGRHQESCKQSPDYLS